MLVLNGRFEHVWYLVKYFCCYHANDFCCGSCLFAIAWKNITLQFILLPIIFITSKEEVVLPVKLTNPLTPILYITSDLHHMEELRHAIHVHSVDEGLLSNYSLTFFNCFKVWQFASNMLLVVKTNFLYRLSNHLHNLIQYNSLRHSSCTSAPSHHHAQAWINMGRTPLLFLGGHHYPHHCFPFVPLQVGVQ